VPRLAPTLAGCAAFALAACIAGARAQGATRCAGVEPGPVQSVTRVLDGETVVLDDGRELRLIGALAPRALDADAEAGAWPKEAAAVEALRALVLGKSIELRFGPERTDRYGRLQAHAFLLEGELNGDKERRWVQGALLQQGFFRAYALAGDRTCADDLLAAERPAREARRGLWAEAAYQVRPTDNPGDLTRYRTTFQIVEGIVLSVGLTSGSIYLNFDRNRRRGFSVSLRRRDNTLLGAYADNPKSLEGGSVRVRGWIDQRGGAPVIDMSAGGLIEVPEMPPRPDGGQ
jgi:endonuclease YncB( thermonuclease family)